LTWLDVYPGISGK